MKQVCGDRAAAKFKKAPSATMKAQRKTPYRAEWACTHRVVLLVAAAAGSRRLSLWLVPSHRFDLVVRPPQLGPLAESPWRSNCSRPTWSALIRRWRFVFRSPSSSSGRSSLRTRARPAAADPTRGPTPCTARGLVRGLVGKPSPC